MNSLWQTWNANDVFGSVKILNEDIYVNYLFDAKPPIQRNQIQQLAEETNWPMIKGAINIQLHSQTFHSTVDWLWIIIVCQWIHADWFGNISNQLG